MASGSGQAPSRDRVCRHFRTQAQVFGLPAGYPPGCKAKGRRDLSIAPNSCRRPDDYQAVEVPRVAYEAVYRGEAQACLPVGTRFQSKKRSHVIDTGGMPEPGHGKRRQATGCPEPCAVPLPQRFTGERKHHPHRRDQREQALTTAGTAAPGSMEMVPCSQMVHSKGVDAIPLSAKR